VSGPLCRPAVDVIAGALDAASRTVRRRHLAGPIVKPSQVAVAREPLTARRETVPLRPAASKRGMGDC
jgi:hypothetical protein